MFGSKIFRRVFLVVSALVVLNAVALYVVIVPPMRASTYEQEQRAAKTLLDSVHDLVRIADQNIQAYRRSALAAYKRELQNLVALQEAYIESEYAAFKAGKLSEKEAQHRALETLRGFLYGHNDYVWVSDYSSRLISHPDPKLHNSDFSKVRDIKGRLIVPPMVAIAREHGEGFYSYSWRRLGEKEPVEKLTFTRHYPKWRWVIGTGVYIDDIDRVVGERRRAAIRELRQILHPLRIAKTGYMFVIDARKQMIVHPSPALEGRDISGLLDPQTGRPIADEIIEAARRAPPRLSYLWDRPDDPKHYVYEKISWVRHYPGLEWYLASSVYVEELKASSVALRNRILAVSVLVLLCSLGASFLFIRRLLRPIEGLSALAARVKEGHLDARSGICRNDEIGVLAAVFDEMVARLRENIGALDAKVKERTVELAQRNEELQASLGRLEQIQQELVASERRAVAASRLKSAFLANMSHELRTPLNAIIGYAEIIVEDAADGRGDDIPNDAEKIRTAGRHLLALINDVLDISKIEAGRMEIEPEPFELAPTIEELVATVRPQAQKNGNQLAVDLAAGLGTMRSDATKVRQILLNLLSNACKFTRDGVVALRVRREPAGGDESDVIAFEVRDTGIGIATDEIERMFEPFVQADASTTRRYGGTGLGLAICRHYAWALGGQIHATSEPGVGSTFVVRLAAELSAELAKKRRITFPVQLTGDS